MAAAQLTRINDLSRELIATRVFLSTAAQATPRQPSADVAKLGLDALLNAAARLDLQAADAILNLSCLLTTSTGETALVTTILQT